MNRIKIAHLTTSDLSIRYLLLNQLKYLKNKGFDVLSMSSVGSNLGYITKQGIRHIAVPLSRKISPFNDLICFWKLIFILRREKVIILHSNTPKASFIGPLAARIAGVPIIIKTASGLSFLDKGNIFIRKLNVILDKISSKVSDIVFLQNKEDFEIGTKKGIFSINKSMHLGNGIDLTRFDPSKINEKRLGQLRKELGISTKDKVVGFVGRLVEEKGLLDLLEAAKIVLTKLPYTKFLIIGPIDREKQDSLDFNIAKKYGVDKQFIFTGMRENLPELYSLMDVFVLPSYRERFPRSPMEASAMGVPCVVSDISGCRQAVINGKNGLLVKKRDFKALAMSILYLLSDPKKAKIMGERGETMALERFDEKKMFDEINKQYHYLLKAKSLI